MGTNKGTTGGQTRFASIPSADIQRSQFNRSNGLKTTFQSGLLIPVFVDEVLPGDTMNLRMHTFARLATPIHPIMDNLYLDSFFFAVPIRIIWNNWAEFNGEQFTPGDSTDFLIPTITMNPAGAAEQSLDDYFGLPVGIPGLTPNSLHHRAYNLIWNEWFRDQNLQGSARVDRGDGPDVYTDYILRSRGKRHDYFTSCLPWPQKGDAVTIPIIDSAPVIPDPPQSSPSFQSGGSGPSSILQFTGTDLNAAWNGSILTAGSATWDQTNLKADLSGATAITINSLREAFQIQKLFERDARGGTRYTEIIRAHFGVTSPDARLQRPEFLGGGSQIVNVSPVAQTSESNDAVANPTPQGNLAAFGVSSGSNHSFTKSFTEHCVIIGLISVRADLNYQQGLDRMFSRRTRFDFYWPALAHIGEQAVLNQEIYAQGSANPTEDAEVFGYQERWAEYRYKPSKITGQMRSSAATSLDTWHLAQDFTTLPGLDDNFITDNPPINRIIAVPSEPEFLLDAYFEYKCARPMPTYSVPGLIDHF